MFKIADNLQIEAHDVAGKRIGVVGKSGSGKTNSLQHIAELWMDNGWPLIIVDPMGDQLRPLKTAYPVLLAGAQEDDDLLIDPDNAAQIAEFCFRQRLSIVLDMSMHPKKVDMDTLVAFLERFWELTLAQKKADAQPWALMVDEAQMYAPQRGETLVSPILIDMGKRGRHKNLTMVVATQRPASIQKDFLTQTNMVIWHQIMLGTDTALLQESLPLKTRELNAMMRSFHPGEALVIGDGNLINGEDYLMVQVHRSTTASHDAETRLTGGSELKAIDPSMMEALRKSLSKPPAATVSSDTLAALRQKDEQIASLKRENLELAQKQQKVKVEIKQVEVPLIRDEQLHDLRMTAEQMIEHGQSLIGMGQEILMALKVKPQSAPRAVPADHIDLSGKLVAGARKVLQALARRYPVQMTRAQLGTLSGYTASGGTFGNYFSILKKRQFIIEEAGQVSITPDGLSFLGSDIPAAPQNTEELLEMWRGVLSKGERTMLDVLVNLYPEWMSREQLGYDAGYTASGGTFGNYLSTLRNNGLIVVEGQRVRASETLFMDVRVR